MKALTCRHRFLSDLPPPAHPAEFEDICEAAASSQSMSDRQAWRNLIRREYRPSLIMAVCIPTFQQWTGINAIMFYVPILFSALGAGKQVRVQAGAGASGGPCGGEGDGYACVCVGGSHCLRTPQSHSTLLPNSPLTLTPSPPPPPPARRPPCLPALQGALLNAVIIGCVNLLSTFVSIALVDKAGRRKLFMEGGIQMCLSQVRVWGVWVCGGVYECGGGVALHGGRHPDVPVAGV